MTSQERAEALIEEIIEDPKGAPLPGEGVSWAALEKALAKRLAAIENEPDILEHTNQTNEVWLGAPLLSLKKRQALAAKIRAPQSMRKHKPFLQSLGKYSNRLPVDQRNSLTAYFSGMFGKEYSISSLMAEGFAKHGMDTPVDEGVETADGVYKAVQAAKVKTKVKI